MSCFIIKNKQKNSYMKKIIFVAISLMLLMSACGNSEVESFEKEYNKTQDCEQCSNNLQDNHLH